MRTPPSPSGAPRRIGLARALSKAGVCSRSQAAAAIAAGRVCLNGRRVLEPEAPTRPGDRLELDGQPVREAPPRYLMLNKPRGLLTTARDEKGRETVFRCLADAPPGHLAPVGRLDKASEGLLLFSNDSVWAAGLMAPGSAHEKCYHVQIDRLADAALLQALRQGRRAPALGRVRLLRAGARRCWLEVGLHEGRNRQIRRALEAEGVGVLRLIRIGIGPVQLGSLARGHWRFLTPAELTALSGEAGRAGSGRRTAA